jgi:hypothetical protein
MQMQSEMTGSVCEEDFSTRLEGNQFGIDLILKQEINILLSLMLGCVG